MFSLSLSASLLFLFNSVITPARRIPPEELVLDRFGLRGTPVYIYLI